MKDPRLERAGVEGFNKPKRTPSHPTKSHPAGSLSRLLVELAIATQIPMSEWVDIAIQQADKPTCAGIAKKLNELGIKTYLDRQWTGSNVQWYFNTIKEREKKYGGETHRRDITHTVILHC